jgi:catechol 2,3-dioxygenase-like lactoylglutathione lyase family enzyme
VAVFEKTRAFSGFSVDDIEGARQFYEGTLGLNVTEENGMLGLHIPDGGNIMIYPKPDHTPATFTILNFPVEDIDRAVDDLTGRGIEMVRYQGMNQDEKGIMRDDYSPPIAWFLDPAGNVLSVLED